MARKHYQLPYDDELDHDIVAFLAKLDTLTKDRKAEIMRSAVRLYMDYMGEKPRLYFPQVNFGQAPTATPVEQPKPEKKKKKRPGFTGAEFN